MQQVNAIQVLILEALLALLPLEAGRNVLQDTSWHSAGEHATQVAVWIFSAGREGLHEFEAERLASSDLQAIGIFAARVRAGMRDGGYLQLLRLGEWVCIYCLGQT